MATLSEEDPSLIKSELVKYAPSMAHPHSQTSKDDESFSSPVTTVSKTTPIQELSSPNIVQQSNQIRCLLEPQLHFELRNCTYKAVTGFYKKCFQDIREAEACGKMYNRLKQEFLNKRWKNLPETPSEPEFWEWWSDIQDKYLKDLPRLFLTAKTMQELADDGSGRQLDIFVIVHNSPLGWNHVLVVGGQTVSTNTWQKKYLRLAMCAREVFSSQSTRLFVHGFLITGGTLQAWIFDRSGAYSSEAIGIHEQPERFIRVLVGYLLMTEEELGLDTFIKENSGHKFVEVEDETTRNRERFDLGERISCQRAIVSHGTSCFLTKDGKSVVKFSWASDKLQTSESALLQKAERANVEGVVRLQGLHKITSINDLRKDLTFGQLRNLGKLLTVGSDEVNSRRLPLTPVVGQVTSSPEPCKRTNSCHGSKQAKKASLSSQMSAHSHDDDTSMASSFREANRKAGQFQNRELQCLVMYPAGRRLKNFHGPRELLTAFRDAIKAHRALFMAGVLHRDISSNNIVITDPKFNNGWTGMLIDLDIAVSIDEDGENEGNGTEAMAGTLPFMAIEVLRKGFLTTPQPSIKAENTETSKEVADHTYRFDLESFFYVFLWICIRYGLPRKRSRLQALERWYIGTNKQIVSAKRGNMSRQGFEDSITSEFPAEFQKEKDLARRLREILFVRPGETDLYTDTPERPESLYDPMMDAFEQALAKYGG